MVSDVGNQPNICLQLTSSLCTVRSQTMACYRQQRAQCQVFMTRVTTHEEIQHDMLWLSRANPVTESPSAHIRVLPHQ